MELKLKTPEPFICLNMIVKNESHIIETTLSKLLDKIKFDYWVISDTGSTDNTKEKITSFFEKRNIQGELFEDEWKDFGHNRTLALQHAFGKSKYIFVFDADDEICGNFVLPIKTDSKGNKFLEKDGYYVNFGDANGISYSRILLVNNNIRWKYIGVLHECIQCCETNYTIDFIQGNYYTISGRCGARSKDKDKYLKDAIVLEKAYEVALQNKDAIYMRYAFYCANSYFDCKKFDDAIKWYKLTLTHDCWNQEKYIACLKLFYSYRNINQQETGFFYLVQAFSYDNQRVDCLHELIAYYNSNKMYEVAYNYYKIVKDFYEKEYLNTTMKDKLFLEIGKYDFHLPFVMILVADKVKQYDTVIQMFRIIFTKKNKEQNKHYVGNLLYNLQFFIDMVDKTDHHFFQLFKEYIDHLNFIGYSLEDHNFMSKYEKYGIFVKDKVKPSFTQEECAKSNKILFYTGFSGGIQWNNSYSENNALGGSETAVACLVNNFPKNYEIYVSGQVKEEKYGNVTYVDLNNLKNLINKNAFHTIIISRYIGFYEMFPNFSAYKTFIWGHDTQLYHYGCDKNVVTILNAWDDKITGCVCQTEWHKNLFITQYPSLKNKIHVINNGIQIKNYNFSNKKVPNRFLYSSCAERGLQRLLNLWPTIIKNIPDAHLFISSYNDFPRNDQERKMLEIIQNNPSIQHVGKLNKTQLYEMMSTAEYWLYPSYFTETSCITSMEMLMSEVICLYYPVAGLVDTLGDYGVKISEGNELDTLLSLTNEQKETLKKNGRIYAETCSWENRASSWSEIMFGNEDEKKNVNINETNKIKVINLKKREDRKKSMVEQLEKENITNYEIIEAVDGNELNESEEIKLLFEGNNFNYRKGIIGCALSHLQIWKQLVNDNDNEYYVILEDDLELLPGFKEKLNIHCKLFEEQKLQHLSLGVFDCNEVDQQKIQRDEIKLFQKDVYKFWNVAFAYILSKNAAKKMVSHINKCSIKCAIDNPLSHGEVINYHHTTVCIAKQRKIQEVGTDIQNNYNCFKFDKNQKKDLRIAYCDWWSIEYCGGHFDLNNNFITDVLRKYGNNITVVNPNDKPDVLLYSIFGNAHKNYSHLRRVFFSGEPFGIRSEAVFNITFDKNSDMNCRFPLWLGYLNDYLLEECKRRKNGIINVPKRENFCSFISNGEVKTTHRRTIVEKLSKYKKVHCGGNYLNNIGYNVPRGVNCSGKIEHNNKYKFAIAFENEDYPGYVTEKICDVYKSNCIPIYWGTTEVVKDFNPSTFINARDFANFDDLVDYIIKVDNDDELYASFFKEPMFSNKWLDAFNDPNKTFYKNLSDLIIGKNNNLVDNYFVKNKISDKSTNTNVNIFNIWHNKLFDKCYDNLDDNSLRKITMYDVNKKYPKVYNKDKKYNIVKEYELKIYNSLYQETNYCQTSCLYHAFVNKLYSDCDADYIGFIQYDMILSSDFIYDIEQKINTSENDIYFYSLAVANKIEVNYICKPYNNSILEKYNEYFNTTHTYDSIKSHNKADKFICLHTFVIPTKTYIKMMTWYCSITDWLHKNYVNGIYCESMSEVTEEIFGLFLLLQMIEDDTISLDTLKLYHEWPKLHNETEFDNYKIRMPEKIKSTLEYNMEKIKEKYDYECQRYSDINQHLPTLYSFATKCESIIECGVRGCISSWAFALGLLNNNKPKKSIFLNDIEKCDIDLFLELTKNIGLNVDYKWCSDLDLQVNEKVDLTFIDTLHVYGQLKRELNKFSKVTNKYIIMHDTTVDEIYGECIRCNWDASKLSQETGFPVEEINKGLWPAIDEFLESNPEWELYKRYTNNNGLTILKKNITINYDINTLKFEYGIDDCKIDITDRVKQDCVINDSIIYINHSDNVRAKIFGDNLFGILKSIFITDLYNNTIKCDNNEDIIIDIKNNSKLVSINPDILTVYKSPYNKIRLGKDYDGGYIVCDIPNITYDFLLSGGILDDISFEEDFCDKYKGIECYAYDGYINYINIKNSNITFIKKYIGPINENNFTNLHDVIDKYNNIFVKMDIEGGEIEWLKSLNETHLNKFSQIAIEFHNPFTSKEIMAFEKLNKTHVLVHFHANNCCGVRIHKGVKIPNVFECTYIHKKYYIGPYKLNNENIPGLLDMKNVLDKDEIIIDYKPFVNI